MKRGQTIVAEREKPESESERMQARKKSKRRSFWSVLGVLLALALVGLVAYTLARGFVHDSATSKAPAEPEYQIRAQLVDESGRSQVSTRMKEYIARLEQDLRDLGYTATRFTLPLDMSRTLYVDLEGETMYFKVSLDRDAAVTAEDAVRTLRYLHEHDLHPAYVDVRVEGKAYYK